MSRHLFRNAVLLGIFKTAVVEMIFLVLENLFGAAGVAAHPNLIIDLLLTMPWYMVMVCSFAHADHRRRFSTATILLLGAIYELGAHGLVGPLVGLVFSDAQILDPLYWLLLGTIAFWQFIPIYSSMLLPPSLVMNTTVPATRAAGPVRRDAVRPLLWLFPIMGYVLDFTLLPGFFTPQ